MTPAATSLLLHKFSIAFYFLFRIHGVQCFYIPGFGPQDFIVGDLLRVKVNNMTSTKTHLSYSYYSLPYCRPDTIVGSTESLWQVLRGIHIENSPYEFKMRVPQMCNVICRIILDAKTALEFKQKIDGEYRVNMILDNLPLAVPIKRLDWEYPPDYQLGFRIGFKGRYDGTKEDRYFLLNHLAFTVKYYRHWRTDSSRIVGFEVRPFSVKHEYEGSWNDKTRLITCNHHAEQALVNSDLPQEVEEKSEIIFTYDVKFQETDVKWESRWDAYKRI